MTATTIELGGRIGPILETIRTLHGMGIWLEIVTLLIPGFNDSEEELRGLTEFHRQCLARHSLARDRIPQRLQNGRSRRHASAGFVARRRDRQAGGVAVCLCRKFVREVGDLEDTHCHRCRRLPDQAPWIFRRRLSADRRRQVLRVPAAIPGRWAAKFAGPDNRSPFLAAPGLSIGYNPVVTHFMRAPKIFCWCVCLCRRVLPPRLPHAASGRRPDCRLRSFRDPQQFWLRTGVMSNKEIIFLPTISCCSAMVGSPAKQRGLHARSGPGAVLGHRDHAARR